MADAQEESAEIADDLRRRIRDGDPRPGQRLPAPDVLRRRYGTDRPTVTRALDALRAEGLLDEAPGGGFAVRPPRRPVRRSDERHQWEKNRARQSLGVRAGTGVTEHDTGLAVDDLVFSAVYREVEAGPELAGALAVPVGTPLVERSYRTRHSTEPAPFNLTRSFLVRERVAGNPELLDAANEPWPGGTQSQLSTVGIEVARIVEEITAARLPTEEEARVLAMPPGAAVIDLRQRCLDVDDRVVELSEITLPGDRTRLEFVTRLDRW
ncbi:GntR family transcriptional regulator [Streptomyces sp. NBRC 109706]|uniref:GntR family transcriptional regulator n=1 Tax=Streptomyces sp. NBRC 109706 TaxID=1550035 RepID=UPI0007849F42|nr:GntR family transcriptional regulator [Streptomyces sp. NBRC 109706]